MKMTHVVMSFALLGTFVASVNAQEKAMTTKVYNVADLLDSTSMLSEETDDSSSGVARVFGGMGGIPGAGGGMFRIADNVLPQFAEMGGGGMGGGGMGGFGGVPQVDTSLSERMTRQSLQSIIFDHVSGDEIEWVPNNGIGGSISIVGSMMIVTQTADVHTRVGQLLEALKSGKDTSPTVQIDVRVVEVAADQQLDFSVDQQIVEKLATDPTAAKLSLRCENHRVANVSSGLKRSYVVAVTPVVGSNGVDQTFDRNIGYSPKIESTLLGLFGRIKPDVAEDGKSARIHLGIRLASGPEEVVAAEFGTGQSVDRVEIEAAQLETSTLTKVNSWTLAGSVAVCDPKSGLTSGEAMPHVAVLVRWKPID